MRLLPVAAILLAAGAAAQAPSGYRTYENKLAAVTFFYPVAFKELPVPPTEQVVKALFVRSRIPKSYRKVRHLAYAKQPPRIYVFLFENVTTITGEKTKKDGKDGKSGPKTLREAMEKANRVTSWSAFAKRFDKEGLKETGAGEYRPKSKSGLRGLVLRKDEGRFTMGVYGWALEPYKDTLRRRLKAMLRSMKLRKAGTGKLASAKVDRAYKYKNLRAVAERKKIRSSLAKGWKAVDTENYVLVHHSRNVKLINKIARDIEAMRGLYKQLFPPQAPIDRLCIVRVCRTLDEYHKYGGRPGTGGYWHPGNEELVLFDYSYTQRTMDRKQRRRMRGRTLSDKDSMLVLYHEAFHQYIHYAVGQFAPHDWFNEGYGDYFSGAVIPGMAKKVARIGPSKWRIHRAKDQCELGKGKVSLSRLLRAPRVEFYGPRRSDYYAAAWAFVYFLKTSKAALKHERWSSLLEDYFAGLTSAYKSQIAKAGADPSLRAKQLASLKARDAAIEKTLKGIDIDELERSFHGYIKEMRDPWPKLRKRRRE